jgi:hypothetical protein
LGNIEKTKTETTSTKKETAQMHCPQKVRHYLGAFLWQKTESTERNLNFKSSTIT